MTDLVVETDINQHNSIINAFHNNFFLRLLPCILYLKFSQENCSSLRSGCSLSLHLTPWAICAWRILMLQSKICELRTKKRTKSYTKIASLSTSKKEGPPKAKQGVGESQDKMTKRKKERRMTTKILHIIFFVSVSRKDGTQKWKWRLKTQQYKDK